MKSLFLLLVATVLLPINAVWGQSEPATATPQSNATQLSADGDQPVNPFTGVANVTVPLLTAQSRTLSVPVALNYKTTGIRVNQVASTVGLGWTLQAGGVITRVVKGEPDTYSCPGGDCAVSTYDEPDVYYFSFLGSAGRFYFGGGWTATGSASVPDFVTVPASQLRIEAQSATTSGTVADVDEFVITTEGGSRFVFGQNVTGFGDAREKTQLYINGVAEPERVTAWYLTRIEAADLSDVVLFEYANYNLADRYHSYTAAKNEYQTGKWFTTEAVSATLTAPPAVATPGGLNLADYTEAHTDRQVDLEVGEVKVNQGVRLMKIHTARGTVEFAYGTTMYGKALDQALDNVYLKDRSGTTVTTLKLGYGVFGPPGLTTANDQQRLKLEYVEVQSSADNLRTSFTYDGTPLPARSSLAQDHWGFFNGATSNAVLAPPANGETFGANRAPAWPAMRAATLTEVTYPTGGKTVFTYEANETASGTVGGLRVRQVEIQPDGQASASDNIVRRYHYTTTGFSGGGSSGQLVYTPGHIAKAYKLSTTSNGSYRVAYEYTYQVASTAHAYSADAHIEYSLVGEHRGASGENGVTVTEYTHVNSAGSTCACGDLTSETSYYTGVPVGVRDWKRGLPLKVSLYDMTTPGTPKKLTESTTTYSFDDEEGAPLVSYSLTTTGASATNYVLGSTTTAYPRNFTLTSSWVYAEKSQTEVWERTTITSAVTSHSTYTYNDRQQLTETESFGSAGEVRGSLIRYVSDYPATGGTSAEAQALQLLYSQGKLSVPVEVVSYKRTAPSTTKYVLGAALTVFESITVNGVAAQGAHVGLSGTVVVTKRTLGLELASPLLHSSFTNSTISSGDFTYDSHYESTSRPFSEVSRYDAFGRAVEVKHANGSYSSTLFSKDDFRPAASASNGRFVHKPGSGLPEGTVAVADFEVGWETDDPRLGHFVFGGATNGGIESPGFTGDSCLTQSDDSGVLGDFIFVPPDDSQDRKYLVTGWVKTPVDFELSIWARTLGSTAPYPSINHVEEKVLSNTGGEWQRFELVFDLGYLKSSNSISQTLALHVRFANGNTAGKTYLDDVRVQPIDATMSMRQYTPFFGARSVSGADNRPVFFEYDALGRRVIIRDFEGNLLSYTDYNIAN